MLFNEIKEISKNNKVKVFFDMDGVLVEYRVIKEHEFDNIGFYEDEKTSCADKRIRFATQADNLKYQTGYKRHSKERYKAQEEYEVNWDNELYSYSTNYKKSSDGFIQASEKYIVNSQGKIVEYHQNPQSNWSKAILEFNQGKLQRINKNCSTKLNNITGEQISAHEVVEFDSFEKPILEF